MKAIIQMSHAAVQYNWNHEKDDQRESDRGEALWDPERTVLSRPRAAASQGCAGWWGPHREHGSGCTELRIPTTEISLQTRPSQNWVFNHQGNTF